MKIKFIVCLSIALTVFANHSVSMTKGAQANQFPMVKLYASDNTKNLISSLPLNTDLVQIYQKGSWIKVGNPSNGNVGWVNFEQYHKALHDFYQPDIQTVYISSSKAKNGKPKINVIAYKNGKKISQKQANKIYKQIRAQQEVEAKSWHTFNQNMIKMQQEIWDDFTQNLFFSQPMGFSSICMSNSGAAISNSKGH